MKGDDELAKGGEERNGVPEGCSAGEGSGDE